MIPVRLYMRFEPLVRLGGALLVAVFATLLLAWLLAGCGWGAAACKSIDVAQQGCAVIKYLGPKGEVVEVPISNEELQGFAQATAASRAASKHTGGDAGR